MEFKGKNNPSLANPIYAPDLTTMEFDIIDIRDESDYAYAHIKNSQHFNNAQDVYNYAQKHKDKNILLVCYSGHTASVLGSHLVEAGCEHIYYFDDYFTHFELFGLLNTQQS